MAGCMLECHLAWRHKIEPLSNQPRSWTKPISVRLLWLNRPCARVRAIPTVLAESLWLFIGKGWKISCAISRGIGRNQDKCPEGCLVYSSYSLQLLLKLYIIYTSSSLHIHTVDSLLSFTTQVIRTFKSSYDHPFLDVFPQNIPSVVSPAKYC